ncbi:helix-turn-helix domain-containing protein [Aerococcaceae bacterium DSM 111022]|nr:helix-turn-helix domain-containing protein [Aerococcaceae bacterium DSM 111022]
MVQSSSYIAIPPGATILELLYVREMSLEELSEKMGCSEEYISKLIDGTTPLTSNVALEIESVLGVPTLFWNNLESNYREQLFLVENEIKTILNGHSINYQ